MARTEGMELMQQIGDGRLRKASSEAIRKTREQITAELEELLETGARIRPLLVGGERIGWVRGIHLSERRALRRYITDRVELLSEFARIGTTLSPETIRALRPAEMHNLMRLIYEMGESDLRLYPYLTPFATTSISEQLWFARGRELTAWSRRKVKLPDGARMKLLAAPDQARLWAALCVYREHSKRRVDEAMNALMLMRCWAGKAADPIATDLKATLRALVPDIEEPWTRTVKAARAIDLDDGWAHGEAANDAEGVRRELDGMLSNDRHERVIAAWEAQQKAEAERERESLMSRIPVPGAESEEAGFHAEVMTADQVRQRVREMQDQKTEHRRSLDDPQRKGIEQLKHY